MEKVKVSQAIANAIEDTRSNGFSDESIISAHAIMPNNWSLKENKALNGMSLDTLIRALYFGYEIEQTPEEKILDEYNWRKPLNCGVEGGMYREGMKFVLNALNIKIKGVND